MGLVMFLSSRGISMREMQRPLPGTYRLPVSSTVLSSDEPTERAVTTSRLREYIKADEVSYVEREPRKAAKS